MADISQIYHNGVLYGLEDKTARKLSPLNIKSFGAKGDGMTDDTEAIILAVQCGAPVFFPCGTYLLSRQIDVSKNICFYGEGECSLIKLIPADQSRTEENDDGVTVYTCNMFFSDENTPAKLELRNLSLDASKADYSNDVLNNGSSKNDITRCIYLNYPESIKFSGVSLKNSTADGALIICGNATKVNIENCRFDSCGFSNNAANGLTIEGGNSVSVSNCSFDKNSGNGLSVSTVNSYYSNVKASDNGYDGIFICNGARDNAFNGVHCCKNRSGIFIKSDNDLSHIDYGRLEQPTHNTFCNTVCENNVYGIMLGASKDTILNGFCSRDDYFYAICCNCEITGHLYNENISASIGYGYDFTGGDITGFTVGVCNKLICEYALRKAYKTYSATSGIIDTTTGSFISGNGITTDYIPLLSRNILLSSPAENIYVCAYGKDKKLLGEYFNGSSFALVQSGADFSFAENVRYIRCFAIGSSRGTFSIEYTFENISPTDNGGKLLDIVDGKAFSPSIELSATGEAVIISDSASAKIKGLTLYGKSRQDETTGAQLMQLEVSSGVKPYAIFNEDGSVTITNTSGNAISAPYCTLTGLIPAGTYTVKNISGATLFMLIKGAEDYSIYIGVGSSKTFEYDGETILRFEIAENNTSTPVTYKAMLNAGTTALEYEPYTGGKASPSPDYPQEVENVGGSGNIEVDIYGKNLIEYPYVGYDNAVSSNITFTVNPDKSITIDGTTPDDSVSGYATYRIADAEKILRKLKVGTIYYLNQPETDLGAAFRCIISVTNTLINKPEYLTYAFEWKAEYDFRALYIQVNPNKTVKNFTFYPQLEVGNIATEYEQPVTSDTKQTLLYSTPNGLRGIPVSSNGNYTDESGQQWICDEVDFAKGIYIQRIGVYEFTGNESSTNLKESNTAHNIGHRIVFTNVFVRPTVNDSITEVYSNAFQPTNANFAYTTYAENCIATDSYGVINFYTPMTLDEFRAYLAEQYSNGTPVKVYYVMKNEIKNSLSPMEIHKFNSAQMNYPVTTVFNQNNCFMKVDYCADTKLYVDRKITELMHSQNSV